MHGRCFLLNANTLHIPLPDESVHCIVTSPPYWTLRDYGLPPLVWDGEPDCAHVWGERVTAGEGYASSSRRRWQHGATRDDSPDEWQPETGQGKFCRRCGAWRGCLGLEPTPELYVAHLVEVFREVWRVLRADGTLWLNLGDTYAHDTKWGGRSGRKNAGSVAGGYQTCRNVRTNSGLKPKDLVGIPWRVALALQADGWWLRSDVVWHKPNCMPESVTDRPTKAHEYLFLLTKSGRYFYDAGAIKELAVNTGGGTFSDKYAAAQPAHGGHSQHRCKGGEYDIGTRNRRTVWTIPTQPYSGAHFATFPPALVEPCIKAGTSGRGCCSVCGAPWERVVTRKFMPQADVSPERGIRGSNGQKQQIFDSWDGYPRGTTHTITTGWQPTCACEAGGLVPAVVLDPFVGSGTTLLVARALGRCGLGLDLSLDYLRDQARKRLELDALDAWRDGRRVEDAQQDWRDLPLFGGSHNSNSTGKE